MHRHFAANEKRVPTTVALASLALLAFWTALILPGIVLAQGPGLTTISEVRYSDTGWGAGNNRNLMGRFTASSFTLPRYARAQNYYLRSYDNSSPARFSRYSTALHVDYPL